MIDNQLLLSKFQKTIIYIAIFGSSFISIMLLFIMLGFVIPKLLVIMAFAVAVLFTIFNVLGLYSIWMLEDINAKKDK